MQVLDHDRLAGPNDDPGDALVWCKGKPRDTVAAVAVRGPRHQPLVSSVPYQYRGLVGIQDARRYLDQRLQDVIKLQRAMQNGVGAIKRLELLESPSRARGGFRSRPHARDARAAQSTASARARSRPGARDGAQCG